MSNNNDYDSREFARMQHHPVRLTEGGKRAMQRYLAPKPDKERPHGWLKISPDTWVFTNDGSINQYKALVVKLPTTGKYKAVIRTMSKLPKWSMQFMELEDAQAWTAVSVYDLIEKDFDFYGPDKVE